MDLSGKVVAMTGAGRGIAEALAERFVAAGARHVVLSDVDQVNVAAVAERLGQPWRRVDVSDASDYDAYLRWIEREIGPIDLCCNHPALHGAEGGRNLETSDELLDAAWATNVVPHIRSARFLVPRFLARGGGYFLQTVTAGALLTLSFPLAYSPTKYAALGFGSGPAAGRVPVAVGGGRVGDGGPRYREILDPRRPPGRAAVSPQGRGL